MQTQTRFDGNTSILRSTSDLVVEKLRDITLVLGDNVSYMKTLPDGAFDLGIVDPPYGVLSKAGSLFDKYGESHKQWDKSIPTDEYFHELFRVTKNQIIWGGNYFPILWNRGGARVYFLVQASADGKFLFRGACLDIFQSTGHVL